MVCPRPRLCQTRTQDPCPVPSLPLPLRFLVTSSLRILASTALSGGADHSHSLHAGIRHVTLTQRVVCYAA